MFWVTLLSVGAMLGVEAGAPYALEEVVYFLGSGVFMTFYTAVFIWIAPFLRAPDLWCSMGRALNNVTAIALGVPTLLVIDLTNPVAVMVLLVPVIIGINALLFATGMLDLHPRPRDGEAPAQPAVAEHPTETTEHPTPNTAPSASDATIDSETRLGDFASRFSLTPRETEVLSAVTADERPLKHVATDMGISLRVLQRHLTSLYQKTGTQSRVGLTKLFWE